MVVHTCWCIWFIAMSGWIQNSKWIQNAFENEIKNDFERKENLKIRGIKKKGKFIFGNLPKLLIYIWDEKYIENIYEFDLILA